MQLFFAIFVPLRIITQSGHLCSRYYNYVTNPKLSDLKQQHLLCLHNENQQSVQGSLRTTHFLSTQQAVQWLRAETI